jgi:hypothetical protein
MCRRKGASDSNRVGPTCASKILSSGFPKISASRPSPRFNSAFFLFELEPPPPQPETPKPMRFASGVPGAKIGYPGELIRVREEVLGFGPFPTHFLVFDAIQGLIFFFADLVNLYDQWSETRSSSRIWTRQVKTARNFGVSALLVDSFVFIGCSPICICRVLSAEPRDA